MVIVAAVDRSERAKRVASEAESLALAFDEPLHVIHVMSRSEFVEIETTIAERGEQSISVKKIRELAANKAGTAAEGSSREYTAVGRVGDPKSEVIQYANEKDARYIVVGGRKRSPAGKAVFGSVTQSILLNADSPVVSVIE
ncbi:universal stress protein [Saliphagus sp. GCM10025334]